MRAPRPAPRRLLGGLLAAGTLFFLVKGLFWLAVGTLALIGSF